MDTHGQQDGNCTSHARAVKGTPGITVRHNSHHSSATPQRPSYIALVAAEWMALAFIHGINPKAAQTAGLELE